MLSKQIDSGSRQYYTFLFYKYISLYHRNETYIFYGISTVVQDWLCHLVDSSGKRFKILLSAFQISLVVSKFSFFFIRELLYRYFPLYFVLYRCFYFYFLLFSICSIFFEVVSASLVFFNRTK